MMRVLAAVLCGCVFVASSSAVWADAVIVRHSRSSGFAGMGAFDGTTRTVTSAAAQREESDLEFTGTILGALQRMAGAGETVRITRLDRDLVWTLDPDEKTYTETSLTVQGERQRPVAGSRPPGQGEPSDVVVTRNEFTVEKTGARKTIGEFPCEEYLVTWLVDTRDQTTGETGKSAMTNRLWTTAETEEIRAAAAEERAYMRAYLDKLGLEISPQDARSLGMAAMTSMGLSELEQERALARLKAEMGKIQGYPIATDIEWRVEQADGGGRAGKGAPASGGGGSPAEVRELVRGLGKLFGGRGGKESERESTGSQTEEETTLLLHLYTEVKSIRTEPSQPNRFEVPADFRRQ